MPCCRCAKYVTASAVSRANYQLPIQRPKRWSIHWHDEREYGTAHDFGRPKRMPLANCSEGTNPTAASFGARHRFSSINPLFLLFFQCLPNASHVIQRRFCVRNCSYSGTLSCKDTSVDNNRKRQVSCQVLRLFTFGTIPQTMHRWQGTKIGTVVSSI